MLKKFDNIIRTKFPDNKTSKLGTTKIVLYSDGKKDFSNVRQYQGKIANKEWSKHIESK